MCLNILSLFSFLFPISLATVMERILKQGGEDLGSISFPSENITM